MRTAHIEYTDVASLADLSFDVFRIIGRKSRPEQPWDYTFSEPMKVMQKMVEDNVLIPHHLRDGDKGWIQIACLNKRAPRYLLERIRAGRSNHEG